LDAVTDDRTNNNTDTTGTNHPRPTATNKKAKKIKIIRQVMEALVGHGCFIVDLTDDDHDGTTSNRTSMVHAIWQTTELLFEEIVNNTTTMTQIPSLRSIPDAGSLHAKVGYASLDDGMMQFVETRQRRTDGTLLPIETASIIGTDGCQSIQSAFRMITELAQATVQIAIAACTQEICGTVQNW
jgi:hypothetical protein